MKSKFDKIMANFIEDNKKKAPQQYAYEKKDDGINDFKNKNMQNNVKGIFKNIADAERSEERNPIYEEIETETRVQVEGPVDDE